MIRYPWARNTEFISVGFGFNNYPHRCSAITPSGGLVGSARPRPREKGARSRHRHQHQVHTVPALGPRPREVDPAGPRPDSIVGLQPRFPVPAGLRPQPTRSICAWRHRRPHQERRFSPARGGPRRVPHRPLEGAMPSRKKNVGLFFSEYAPGTGIMTETSISN